MKKTMTYVLAAAAVVIGLVSCSKEKLPETESEKVQEKEQEKPQQGLRTLTVSFAAGTKTTLGPKDQPVWAEGDKISLNGVVYNVPPEAVGKETCTITTDITGTINAVYPADAYVSESPYYKVADEQNGSFGSANICYAQVESAGNTISFENKTAVFEVKVPAHTKELVVTSLGEIDATTGQRGTTVRPINSTGSDVDAKQKITVTVTDSSSPTTCYVSVLVDENKPVLLTNLNFDAVTGDNAGAQGGVSPNYIKSKEENPLTYKVEVNTIYTPELHEYVKIGGKKWATMNVGASSSTDNGEYFACGSTDGQTWNGTTWSGTGFSSIPLLDGTISDTLPLKYDAANVNWGGAWRMPTKEDFEALILIPLSQSGNAYSFIDSGNQINFPAAGFGRGNDLETTSSGYWSSSLSDNDDAYCLEFSYSAVNVRSYSRHFGHPVRPVSD